MSPPLGSPESRWYRWGEAAVLAVVFAVAHTQSPLYYSNQNQYFLHGLATGGLGHLSHDWLAQTRDPTPLFSALVAAGYRYLGEWSFQAAYFLLLMGYFLSARWLVAALPGWPAPRSVRLVFAAGFTAAHAAVVRLLAVHLSGVDYPWYLQAGVANQYLLGPGLQPSALGTLLLTAVAAFAHGRAILAGLLAAAACLFHSTYLLSAGFLVAGFLVELLRRGERRSALVTGGVALAAVLPVLAYVVTHFAPSSAATFAEAQRILVHVRIPHHAVIARWFAVVDGLQLAWVAVGWLLVRRTRLAVPLLTAATLGLILSLVQLATDSPTLALLFPWRISALLVPIATAVMTARLAALVPASRLVDGLASLGLLLLAGGGVAVQLAGLGYRTNDAEVELHAFVRGHAGPDDVYLLPVQIPALSTGRGSASTTFTPPPRPKPGSNLIPVDWQRFRLHTGACIYVDFKSVPYADAEVVEWLRRMRQAETWYAGDWNAPHRRDELLREGITHVVTQADRPITADYLDEIPNVSSAYRLYRVK
jgi:hypothetical protein